MTYCLRRCHQDLKQIIEYYENNGLGEFDGCRIRLSYRLIWKTNDWFDQLKWYQCFEWGSKEQNVYSWFQSAPCQTILWCPFMLIEVEIGHKSTDFIPLRITRNENVFTSSEQEGYCYRGVGGVRYARVDCEPHMQPNPAYREKTPLYVVLALNSRM